MKVFTTNKKIKAFAIPPFHFTRALAVLVVSLSAAYVCTLCTFFAFDTPLEMENMESPLYAKWVPSDRCRTHVYTEEELDQFQAGYISATPPPSRRCRNATDALSGSCEKVIHSCNREKLDINDDDGIGTVRPYALEWSGLPEGAAEHLWRHLYHTKLSKMRLYLVGDSLMYQVLAAITLTLNRMGIHCSGTSIPGGVSMACPNGLVMVRPFVGQLTDLETLSTYVLDSNITILNTGLHYGTMACSEEGNHYCKDLVSALDVLVSLSRASNKELVWLDTFRPHFPAAGGNYEGFSQMRWATSSSRLGVWRTAWKAAMACAGCVCACSSAASRASLRGSGLLSSSSWLGWEKGGQG